MASTPHLKMPSWELFGALGPQQMHFTCIVTVFFCLQEEKHAFLHGFGAMREQPGTQGEIKNIILPAFLQCFSACKRKKPAFLQGFGAMREQPGTQRELKNSILPAFL